MKKKNKKLKKEFKKLLHAQLSEKIKQKEGKNTIVPKNEDKKLKENKQNKQESNVFIRKDIIKTSVISLILFALIFTLSLYLKNSNQLSEFAKKIVEFFSI